MRVRLGSSASDPARRVLLPSSLAPRLCLNPLQPHALRTDDFLQLSSHCRLDQYSGSMPLLVAANRSVLDKGPQSIATRAEVTGTAQPASSEQDKKTASKTKPRGRPKRQQTREPQSDTQGKRDGDKQKLAPVSVTAKEGRQGVNTL